MSSVDAVPSSDIIPSPDEVWMRDDSDRKSILMDVASAIVDQHVNLSTHFADSSSDESTLPHTTRKHPDSVYAYSCEVLTLGLLFLEFKDSIKGDEDRDMRVFFCYSKLLAERITLSKH